MDKKPFHVLRLKKALEKKQPTLDFIAEDQRELSPTLYSLPAVTPDNSRVLSTAQSCSVFTPSLPLTLVPVRPSGQQEASKSFLPPFLQSDSRTTDFSSIQDSQTLIQNTLAPPPCVPDTWDENRKAIIRKHAVIHHENTQEFEQHVNEASYQLCLRDPTLLVRKDELCLLSKRAVRQGYDHHHISAKPSLSVAPVVGTKRALSQEANPLAKRSYCDPNKKLFAHERISRMGTLQAEMEANVTLQKVKLIALDEARSRGDSMTGQALQEHIDTLMYERGQLKSAFNELKQKQNRSECYFKRKEKKNAGGEPSAASSDTVNAQSPIIEQVDVQLPSSETKIKRSAKRKSTPKKVETERGSSPSSSPSSNDPSKSEIKNLVDNISIATDQMNSFFGSKEW